MRPIAVEFMGGPMDGAIEELDLDKLSMEEGYAFDLPHLTKFCVHIYHCPVIFNPEADGIELHHADVRLRLDRKSQWQ